MLTDFHVDLTLLSAFVEMWHPERHKFHMLWGKVTLTLQDVAYHFKLRTQGDPVGEAMQDFWTFYQHLTWGWVEELLGVRPSQNPDARKELLPIVGFNLVHMHHVDRAMRQLGADQLMPVDPVKVDAFLKTTGRFAGGSTCLGSSGRHPGNALPAASYYPTLAECTNSHASLRRESWGNGRSCSPDMQDSGGGIHLTGMQEHLDIGGLLTGRGTNMSPRRRAYSSSSKRWESPHLHQPSHHNHHSLLSHRLR
ncbi:hypothetical protein PIB30_094392 [Stylosanthes scabra]|uniref:Aminotransferase-like plant mobile domain-containing protein n=1 Tax=Stylosanthes scabra TaxID=79078 RepID=A0ABU6RVY7_9FABA|nr:hypothetical protein [Stylosanthes scabra]